MSPGIALGFASVGLLAIVLGAPGNALLGVVVWAVGIVAWRWIRGVRGGIEVFWEGPVRVRPGAAVQGQLLVRNRTRWSLPLLSVRIRLPAAAADPSEFNVRVRLDGCGEQRYPVHFTAGSRGVHDVRELSWQAPDPLGIGAVRGTGVFAGAMVVTPVLAPVRRVDLPRRSPMAGPPQGGSLFVDETAVVGVRRALPEDPLTRVHWQASAFTGELMSKEYQQVAARELIVCLDLDSDSYQRRGRPAAAEAAISAAASLLTDSILEQRQSAGLGVSAQTDQDAHPMVWRVRGDHRHLHTMLDALAAADVHEAVSITSVIRSAVIGAHAGTTLVVVTGLAGSLPTDAVAAARAQGLQMCVVSVGSGVDWMNSHPPELAGATFVRVSSDRPLQQLRL